MKQLLKVFKLLNSNSISAVPQLILLALVTSHAVSQTVSIACDPEEPLTTFIESSEVNDVLFIDEYAYICIEGNELLIYDITDPQNPSLINQVAFNDSPSRMHRQNNLIYITVDNQDPAIYDISTPSAPIFVGLLEDNQRLLDIKDGLSVCVSLDSDPQELRLYQVEPLGDTTLLSAFPFQNTVYIADIHDGKLYVGSRTALDIYDISDPSNPQSLTNFEDGHLVYDFVLRDSFMIVSDNDDCVRVIDVSNTDEPIVVWEYETIDRPYRVDHFEDYFFVANIDGSVQVFDISNPSSPEYLGLINTPEQGRYVVVSPELIIVYDTNNYATLYAQDSWRGSLVSVLDQSFSDSRDVTVVGNTAYVCAYLEGLNVVDVSDPSNPQLVNSLSTFDATHRIASKGNHIYVTDIYGGLLVYDISQPHEPYLVGWYTSIEIALQLSLGVEHLYLTGAGNERVDILDISNSGHPRRLSTYELGRAAHHAIEHQHVMYVSLGRFGMHIVNIENPFNPIYVGIVDRRISELFISDYLLFTADLTFEIYDVTVPENPLLLSDILLPSAARSFTVLEDLVIISSLDHGLLVIDIADPLNPLLMHSFPTNEWGGLHIQDGLLYGAMNRLEVYDISSICIPCPADLNSDSMLNFLDVSLYLQSFASGSVSADLNDDGQLNFIDISAFLTFYNTSCTE